MIYNYYIKVDNFKHLNDNAMLNCSIKLSFLNNLFREKLITEVGNIKIKRKILKYYQLL